MLKKVLLSIAITALFLLALSIIWFLKSVNASGNFSENQEFQVTAGQGARQIASALAEKGFIGSELAFKIETTLQGVRSDFKAGTFALPARSSIRQIIEILTNLPKPDEVQVLIREGLTAKEIGSVLEQAGVMPANDFINLASSNDSRAIAPERTYEFLVDKPTTASLEGFLFPDTYRFFKKAEPAHVLKKFLDNFEQKVSSELLAAIQAGGHTIYDGIILASIVDKEVRTDTDRKLAAGIFWKRLKIGMALQSDATVNYITGKNVLQPTNADISVDSLYNTYKYPGLPPGPIGNPSLSAIRAVAYPQDSEYLYFLTKPDGTTVFSKTFEEHLANKRKYLQ
ncbi:endolytic transglycosylase MltG [Candidatus Parcubacteria bacterium]|jgi:UPF0755 protein|nr:MAG: endolytic transglycosylase MltG [Candidatus Parcubacteria bacterium]